MNDVTQILIAIEQGDQYAAADLLPLVYDELRQLAARKIAKEPTGQTLQATALVHEAYVRLVDVSKAQNWKSRGHFFAAAAEAMRRILIEQARRRATTKRGGSLNREQLDESHLEAPAPDEQLLAMNDALDELAKSDDQAATLVKLRFFGGLTANEAADALGMSVRSAHDLWAYARSWLRRQMRSE